MRTIFSAAVALAVAVSLPAVPAVAQDGVHLDPNSPAGKEYAVPLDKARREAAGGAVGAAPVETRKRSAAGARSSPPFGEGITRAGRDGAASQKARRSSGRRTPGPAKAAAGLSVASASADRGSPTLVTGGIALAILLAAAGIGLLLHRGLRHG